MVGKRLIHREKHCSHRLSFEMMMMTMTLLPDLGPSSEAEEGGAQCPKEPGSPPLTLSHMAAVPIIVLPEMELAPEHLHVCVLGGGRGVLIL